MPQQLCSQCGERNEGLLLPDGRMLKEAQHVFLLLCLCVTAIVHGLQQGCHLFKPKTADWRDHAAETPRPSELCFAWFMLTNWLLPFLSHICLLVALLRVFFPFLCKSESSRTETIVYNSVHTTGKMGKMGLEFIKHLSMCFPQSLA